MKTEFNFSDVIGRVKKALKINTDKELAEKINMAASTFNSRKTANSIPYDEILALAKSEKLNFDWLLTGEGSMYKNALSEPSARYEVSLKVLYPELTDKEVQMFETEIEEKIEFSRLKKIVYERLSVV